LLAAIRPPARFPCAFETLMARFALAIAHGCRHVVETMGEKHSRRRKEL
jgi:hypothetical protein